LDIHPSLIVFAAGEDTLKRAVGGIRYFHGY